MFRSNRLICTRVIRNRRLFASGIKNQAKENCTKQNQSTSCFQFHRVDHRHLTKFPNRLVPKHQCCTRLGTSSHYEKWTDLSYEDLEALLESQDIQLFDVREPKEIEATGKIPGSVNLPLGEVKEALQLADVDFYKRYKVSKPQKHDTNIVFYGLGPIKSSAALELAHKFDYKKARHYSGGYEEWCKMNKDLSKTGEKTRSR